MPRLMAASDGGREAQHIYDGRNAASQDATPDTGDTPVDSNVPLLLKKNLTLG